MDPMLVLICKDMNGVVPEEIQVIPYGVEIDTPKGKFTLDEVCAPLVMSAFEKQTNQMVIDYEHQTLMGTQAPAAGWIKNLINKGKEGIWAAVEWTNKARTYIANKEYKYVSPVFRVRLADNRVIHLINVALTNQPNIDGMVPLVNKAGDITLKFNKEESIMWKELLRKLNLAETATEAEAIAAVNKIEANAADAKGAVVVANKSVLAALGLADTATEAEITGTIMAMKQSHTQVGDLAKELATLKTSIGTKDAADAVELAMKEGKITPAQKPWADEYAKRDLEGFKVFAAKAPTVVVMGKVVGDDKPAEGALDDTQLAVNKQMGIDTETFKKYNK
jgi:phage I-like protein